MKPDKNLTSQNSVTNRYFSTFEYTLIFQFQVRDNSKKLIINSLTYYNLQIVTEQ